MKREKKDTKRFIQLHNEAKEWKKRNDAKNKEEDKECTF
jgi:hypothetical protein